MEAALQSGDIADLIDDDPLGASGEIGSLGKTGRYYLGKLGATPGAGPAGWFQAQIGPLTLDLRGPVEPLRLAASRTTRTPRRAATVSA